MENLNEKIFLVLVFVFINFIVNGLSFKTISNAVSSITSGAIGLILFELFDTGLKIYRKKEEV